ncbi:MAG: hypothetical protein V8R63_04105 [Thomasclavelia ramosa]
MKILFVGNSHTYMNDMPEMVRINSSEKLEVTTLACCNYLSRPFRVNGITVRFKTRI